MSNGFFWLFHRGSEGLLIYILMQYFAVVFLPLCAYAEKAAVCSNAQSAQRLQLMEGGD